MSNSDTESQSYGDTDDTQDSKDVPPLATSVKTLQEAVQLSLKDGLTDKCLFIFARALKSFERTHNRPLPPKELDAAFALWWSAATPLLTPADDFDEWRLDFLATFSKTKSPLGSNSLQEAILRAKAGPMPPQAERYTNPKIKLLVAVCCHLQLLQGDSPFFLSARAAAKVMEMKNPEQASAILTGLVFDGVLTEVKKGTRAGRRATRFRFNFGE